MSQNPADNEEWIGTMQASKRYGVAPAYLYRLADQGVLETRTVLKGKLRPKILFRVTCLEEWYAARDSHFKRKHEQNERPGRAELVSASL